MKKVLALLVAVLLISALPAAAKVYSKGEYGRKSAKNNLASMKMIGVFVDIIGNSTRNLSLSSEISSAADLDNVCNPFTDRALACNARAIAWYNINGTFTGNYSTDAYYEIFKFVSGNDTYAGRITQGLATLGAKAESFSNEFIANATKDQMIEDKAEWADALTYLLRGGIRIFAALQEETLKALS